MASCLAALPFASLPLVSRPWTVLSWSRLLSLSSVSDCLVVVPRQLVGLGGCSPASPNCPPSRVRKQRSFGFSALLSLRVFAMRSPCRVESVSVLDRNEGSYYTFLVFGRSLLDEVTIYSSLLREGVTLWVECGFPPTRLKPSSLWIAGRYSFRMGSPFSGQILPI